MGRAKERMMEEEQFMAVTGIMPDMDGKKFVCADHFDDSSIRGFIIKRGSKGVCSYCGKETVVVDVSDLAKWCHERINKYFCNPDDDALPLASSYRFDSDDKDLPTGTKELGPYLIGEDTLTFDSTEELLYNFDLTDNSDLLQDIAECFANNLWCYRDAVMLPKDDELSFSWCSFSDLVKHKRRFTFFFSAHFNIAERGVNGILSELNSIIIQAGIIKKVEKGTELFRCRNLNLKSEIKDTFKDMTSPPKEYVAQCRMSPAGIPMFYGAFEKDVAEKEAIGEKEPVVAVARFKATRDLNVVDLTNIPSASIWSDFDYESIAFLREFSSLVSQPVDKKAIHYEYIPTQVFTDYIRYMLRTSDKEPIDGVIYESCKCRGEKNIVLFCDQEESSTFVTFQDLYFVVTCHAEYYWNKFKNFAKKPKRQ